MKDTIQAQRIPISEEGALVLIADVHSNIAALDAVIAETGGRRVFVCAGDITGYYTEPNEVCEKLREMSAICIKGNHDKYVLGELEYPSSREEKYRVTENRKTLTAENRNWLACLPDQATLLVSPAFAGEADQPVEICIAHGSPRDIEEYIYPDTPIDFLTRDEPGFLVLGHTHHPMWRQAGALQVINPGSVGQVRDRKPGASYATLMPFSGKVEFHRAYYDVPTYQSHLTHEGVHSSMVQILSRS
ncbi:metallophosphoesterase family protein [Achromobacter xylosoxidans]|uniref:Metallophosphoesterase family protein n=1 Tax=Alcaligenes xylosoxydans xylosoxydans TaxID=85698 RepID=A0A9X3KUY7_ALCXX|nr:metallophosphoesterase family protein [Achromobacter xylosoxidans]MCZ8400540.1 metallophosphoesterase family protein [Achromobacter xylosoxidans]